jgi:hypothetical protein
MEEKIKIIVTKYIELTNLIKQKINNETNIIEIYDISKKIYTEIKIKYPSLKIIDKIEEAKKIFIENPYKYIDTKEFEFEIEI